MLTLTSVEIMLIAAFTGIACALPGAFLVLRKMTMMSDLISHTILLGIVIGYFITQDLSSPILIIGAAAVGVITVWLTEMLNKTKLVAEDSSIGIIFPLLFSIAVILISRYAGSVHLDTDAVIMGDLVYAPFDRLILFGADIGARHIYVSGFFLLLNVLFITIFFKELKLSAFDPLLAASMGFSPVIMHYALMSMVSVTAVGGFEVMGSILVVAFMVGPPVTAYLLTDDLKKMLWLSAALGGFNSVVGYLISIPLNASISGSIAVVTGLTFFVVLMVAPKRGLISVMNRKRRQKFDFAELHLLFHLASHENSEFEEREANSCSLASHLHWHDGFTAKIVEKLVAEGSVFTENGILKLTDKGRARSNKEYERLFVH